MVDPATSPKGDIIPSYLNQLDYNTDYNWNISTNSMLIPANNGKVTFRLQNPELVLYRSLNNKLGIEQSRVHKTQINVDCELPADRSAWLALEEKEPVIAKKIFLNLRSQEGSSLIQNLHVQLNASGTFNYGSAGTTVSKGVKMQPPLVGVWEYGVNTHLIFKPESPMLPGTKLSVELSEFPGVTFPSTLSESTQVPIPEVTLSELATWQDPIQHGKIRITGTARLSYPLARGILEPRTALLMKVEPQKDFQNLRSLGFEITYSDTNPNIAYIKSENFDIPEEPATVLVRVSPGVESSLGGEPCDRYTSGEVSVNCSWN